MRAPIVVIVMIAAITAVSVAAEAAGRETSPVSSLSMSRATALALEKNHGLMAAVQRTRGSGARVHQAVAAFLPALNFSSTYIRADGGRSFPMHFHPPGAPFEETVFFDVSFVPEKLHETKFQLNQLIFTGGRLYNQLKLARADKRLTDVLVRE